jgi:hypothetical protein
VLRNSRHQDRSGACFDPTAELHRLRTKLAEKISEKFGEKRALGAPLTDRHHHVAAGIVVRDGDTEALDDELLEPVRIASSRASSLSQEKLRLSIPSEFTVATDRWQSEGCFRMNEPLSRPVPQLTSQPVVAHHS